MGVAYVAHWVGRKSVGQRSIMRMSGEKVLTRPWFYVCWLATRRSGGGALTASATARWFGRRLTADRLALTAGAQHHFRCAGAHRCAATRLRCWRRLRRRRGCARELGGVPRPPRGRPGSVGWWSRVRPRRMLTDAAQLVC
uniref:(northern house mosquito) hypothetical protein n=1 Tax=Culex pipiens TaxID=7175 RepID=A0A8D8FEZ6_CULPI